MRKIFYEDLQFVDDNQEPAGQSFYVLMNKDGDIFHLEHKNGSVAMCCFRTIEDAEDYIKETNHPMKGIEIVLIQGSTIQ